MTGEATFHEAHPSIDDKELASALGVRILEAPKPFRQGAYGWLYDMTTTVHENDGRVEQILKVLKPVGAQQKMMVEAEFGREIAALARLSGSPGVPRITWNGELQVSSSRQRALAYVKIKPAATLNDLSRRSLRDGAFQLELSAQTLFDLGLRLLETLEAVHRAGIRHLDIHPMNILVSGADSVRGGESPFDRDIWLIDFGKAGAPWKHESIQQISNELPEFMSEDQKDYLVSHKGRYSAAADNILRSERSMLWDLYAAGRCFQQLANRFEFRQDELLHKGALLEFASILQRSGTNYDQRLTQARERARRWRTAVPRLNQIKIRTFVDSHATVDPALTPIIDSAPVQRLRKVQQLALTQLLYPGATHTRFAHTIGVVDTATKYIDQINQASPLKVIGARERMTCMAYALVHDIGHYPFAHYLEEIDAASLPSIGSLLHHEVLGSATYKRNENLPWLYSEQLLHALDQALPGFDPGQFASVLGEPRARTAIGQIVDGPIDADKLDYLLRDGNACGIAYANGVDVQRLLDSVRCVEYRGQAWLGINPKGVAPASEMYYARFHMYGEVYFHKVSRFIAAAVKRAFHRVCELSKAEEREQLLRKLMNSTEFQFIDWLKANLAKVEEGRFAALLEEPFGNQGRRLFKRVKTYSDLWLADQASRSPEKQVLERLREAARSFAHLGELERALNEELDGRLKPGAKGPACVLIDVPASKDLKSFPMVFGDREPEYLQKISPIVAEVAEAQRRSQRVRVFAPRHTAELLAHHYPNENERSNFIDDAILSAMERLKPRR